MTHQQTPPPPNSAMNFVLKAVVVIVPALITSYFSYRSAKVESVAHASAGYEILLKSVDKLSAVAAENEKNIARLQGHLEAVEHRLDAAHPLGYGATASMPAPPLPAAATILKPLTVFKRPLPRDLDGAFEMNKQNSDVQF